jgi:hypothetical protein
MREAPIPAINYVFAGITALVLAYTTVMDIDENANIVSDDGLISSATSNLPSLNIFNSKSTDEPEAPELEPVPEPEPEPAQAELVSIQEPEPSSKLYEKAGGKTRKTKRTDKKLRKNKRKQTIHKKISK